MRKKLGVFLMSAVMAAQLIAPSCTVLAEPIVSEDTQTTFDDASQIDDDAAMQEADSSKKNSELVDGEKAAKYLLENEETNVIKQVTTDESDSSLPESYDLRDLGVVTPVKSQNPWGTCWGFAAIAACETSILSDSGKTYEETQLDLSEHHLANFARSYLKDGSSQNGEGIHVINEEETFNTGGWLFTAASVLSSGIGPVDESLIPYRGKNSTTEHAYFINFWYSEKDDWSIPSDYEFVQSYSLKESNMLLSPAVYSSDIDPLECDDMDEREAAYEGYDASATDTIKKELMNGHAVSIAFCADTYMPGQDSGVSMYLNTEDNKWTHYTFDGGVPNHAVTIVGWDDSIQATDFLDHTNDEYGDGQAHQPEGNGAWIVKNSWGAETEEFPNTIPMTSWGVQDEEGKATGYFYISYYDRSLIMPETFSFDTNTEDVNDATMVDQYDFLQAETVKAWADKNGLQAANVFTAEADGDIQYVSCQTNTENMSTTYEIYLLNDGAVTPDDGTLAATINEDYAHAGYHKATLSEPVHVTKGQEYSVIVTSCCQSEDQLYYGLSVSTGENEAYVTEYNRKILYQHRGDEDNSAYKDDLKKYYAKGVVQKGESYIYMNELGQWGDFADIIPYLQADEQYQNYDFDNFSIKAYLSFSDSAVASDSVSDYMTTELTYADPETGIYMPYIFKAIGVLVGILVLLILFIILLVRRHKKKKKIKKMMKLAEKVPALEAEIEELRSKLKSQDGSWEEETTAEDASKE